MTELNDHLKLLFARAGQLFDRDTAQAVRHDSAESIYAAIQVRAMALTGGGDGVSAHGSADVRLAITFPVELPANTTPDEVAQWLSVSGFTKVQAELGSDPNSGHGLRVSQKNSTDLGSDPNSAPPKSKRKVLNVVADRFRLGNVERARVLEAIEVGLKHGSGRLAVYVNDADIWQFSTGLHCPESDLHYTDPIASMFSFNSAVGACETCRGFGRVIGVDYALVIPNEKLTLRAGAVKPMQTPAWAECQDDLMRHAETEGIPRDTPWNKLSAEQQHWVVNGSKHWNGKWNQHWFGIKRFFEYLETKAYKMHIRVLLSRYRSYTPCPACGGARLKTESLLWRIGSQADADAVLARAQRFMPVGVKWSRSQLEALPGLCLHDLMQLPIDRLRRFFAALQAGLGKAVGSSCASSKSSPAASPNPAQSSVDIKTMKLLLDEITTRLKYLCEVGIGYLTLDRQSRTLSGGEVQRINLTTALGTSLVNTLFVLDEPSIGLHPRDMGRVIEVMHRLRHDGNSP